MADQFRILVVEDEETLNQSIVNSLRKDGYLVQGVNSGAEAIRILWSEECDVVISDQKTPGADGFELLQWLRTYRPETPMIMLSAYGSPATRAQALEGGAVSYLEKPLNLHQLKEELRRLLQQTGFSASLDSFDLLDVIQIINMSRKSIALLVNTGLEERGVLRFQEGELIWAEYGTLRGEEAFFALAAHKNGTVVHQPWNAQIAPNVSQPLSRLIFQALQYRSKYAVRQQMTGEQEAVPQQVAPPPQTQPQMLEEVDDTPFVFAVDPSPLQTQSQEQERAGAGLMMNPEPGQGQGQAVAGAGIEQEQGVQDAGSGEHVREWWQDTGQASKVVAPGAGQPVRPGGTGRHGFLSQMGNLSTQNGANIAPSTQHKTPASQRPDLPAWLTEQPTRADLQPLRPSALSSSGQMPVPPGSKPPPAEWQPPSLSTIPRLVATPVPPVARTTEQLAHKQATGTQRPVERVPQGNAAEWQPPERPDRRQVPGQQPARSSSGPLHGGIPPTPATMPTPIPPSRAAGTAPASGGRRQSVSQGSMANMPVVTNPNVGAVAGAGTGATASHHAQRPDNATRAARPQSTPRRNYQALVSALQTLGYSIPGFVAAAVVGLDGQPVAQVAVDDLDISQMCKSFSALLQGGLRSLEQGGWGSHEETVITSTDRHILLRLVGDASNFSGAFQVLITTREAEPVESLEVMANVEGAISAALR